MLLTFYITFSNISVISGWTIELFGWRAGADRERYQPVLRHVQTLSQVIIHCRI